MKELVEVIAKALVDNPESVLLQKNRMEEQLYWKFMWQTAIWEKLSASRVVLQKQSVLL